MKKLLLLGLMVLLAPPAGWACSCHGKSSVESEYRFADLVVEAVMIKREVVMGVGRLADLERRLDASGELSKYEIDSTFEGVRYARYTFTISHNYKGAQASHTVIVSTGMWDGDCGVQFKPEKTYLIYAFLKEGRYWTHLCTRTQEYNPTEAAALEKLQQQAQGPKPASPQKRKPARRKASTR